MDFIKRTAPTPPPPKTTTTTQQVMRVLEEPTAAAIAYGLHQKPNVHHILVYDFGGGALVSS